MTRTKKLLSTWLCLALLPLAVPVEASIVFSQTPIITTATTSDVDNGAFGTQFADNFILAAPATVRSATWRGVFTVGNTTIFPLNIDLFIYGNTVSGMNDIPDLGNVIATTSVTFSPGEFTDTGDIFVVGNLTFEIFEFQANLPPTALAASTKYWFSVLADTTGDPASDWAWAKGGDPGDGNALRQISNPVPQLNTFSFISNGAPFYFILDDAVLPAVPEATSLAVWAGLVTVGAVGSVFRRRPKRT
jgi:hypothetical protein